MKKIYAGEWIPAGTGVIINADDELVIALPGTIPVGVALTNIAAGEEISAEKVLVLGDERRYEH